MADRELGHSAPQEVARAQPDGGDDALVRVARLLALAPAWTAFLAGGLGRPLVRRKPGPKPADGRPGERHTDLNLVSCPRIFLLCPRKFLNAALPRKACRKRESDGIFYRVYVTVTAILAGYPWPVVDNSVGIFYTAQRGC